MITVRGLNQEQPYQQPVTIVQEPQQQEQPIDEPIQLQAKLARGMGAYVEIRGEWAWATFNGRPNAHILAELKANKWIWCHNKGKWAWRGVACHSRKNMSWEYITSKYAAQPINDNNKELVSC